MAPIGTSKEIAMNDDQVLQHDEDAVETTEVLTTEETEQVEETTEDAPAAA